MVWVNNDEPMIKYWFYEIVGIIFALILIFTPLIYGQPVDEWIMGTTRFLTTFANNRVIMFFGFIYLIRGLTRDRGIGEKIKYGVEKPRKLCPHCGKIIPKEYKV